MNLQFVHPWVLNLLWLIPVIGLVWLASYRRGEQRLDKLFSTDMRRKLCPTIAPTRFYWQYGMLLAATALITTAAARPLWGIREEQIFQRGRDLIIALDVSRSMLAGDVRPNRLERAKTDIMDLVRKLQGDRIGLVVFRGKAVQLCPLTIDYSFLEHALDDVTIDSAPPGPTDIGAGIMAAIDAFEDDHGAHRAIILISDGEDLSDRIRLAAHAARDRNIPVFTIGLGSTQGATIPDPQSGNRPLMYQGEEVITRLVPEAMQKIADITYGVYVPVETGHVRLGPLYRDHLGAIAARDIEEQIREQHVDRYQYFLLPAILLVIATACLSKGRPIKNRVYKKRYSNQ